MPASFDDVARRAAQQLSDELGGNLPAAVEAQLQAGGAAPERYEPGTLIALAALVVNVAKFAWDVYRDRKKDAQAPSADTLARTIRLELKTDDGLSDAQRD